MANIPTIPGTQMVQDQPIGVKMDPTAGLKLNAQVAETVGTAAAVIGQYEEKKQKAVEFDIANKSYLSFTALRQKFDQDAKTLPSDQIVSHWEQTANEWRASQAEQYNSKLSPEARQEFNANWDKAIIGSRGDAQAIADRKQHADFMGTMDNVITKAAYSGNENEIKGAEKVIDTGVKTGIIVQGKAEEFKYKLHVTADEAVVNNALNGSLQDKFVAKEMLKDSDKLKFIPVKQRPIYNRKLDLAIATDQRNNLNELKELRDSGDKVFTEEEVLEKQNKKEIPPDSVKTFMRVQNGMVTPQQAVSSGIKVLNSIDDLATKNGLSVQDLQKATLEIQTSNDYGLLPLQMKRDVEKEFTKINTEIGKKRSTSFKYLAELGKQGKLGSMVDKDGNEDPAGTIMSEEAEQKQLELRKQLNEMYDKNVNWDAQDAKTWVLKQLKSQKTGSLANTVIDQISGANITP